MFRRNECSQTRERLSPYLDQRLNPAQQLKLEEHLRACEVCRQELESLRATVGLLRLTPVVKAPRSFALHPNQAVKPGLQIQGIMRWSTALAAALLFIVLVGDGLSSFALRASPAAAPLMAPAAETQAGDQKGETGGAVPPGARSQAAPPQALTPGPNKAAPSDSAPAVQLVPQAPSSASPPASDAQSDARAEARTEPGQTPAPGLSGFRVAEILLVCVVAILATAGFLAPRIQRRLRRG